METTACPPSDRKQTSSVLPPQSPPQAPPSPPSDHRTQEFASNFTALYHSIFPPKPSPKPTSLSLSITPSTSSPSSSTADDFATEHRLHQARLILEYQELCDHYELSLTRLQTLTNELESLRRENAALRVANDELIELLSLSSQAAIHSHFGNRETVHECAPKRELERVSDFDSSRSERRRSAGGRVSLPKSISVRSSGYQKAYQNVASMCSGGGGGGTSTNSTQPRVSSQHDLLISGSVQQRVFVPASGGGKREDPLPPVELEVYNQGMWKTELCNKWQETGTCPYGDHCQFAHGITELRPVIRHPRYKTQVCRMVLAGDICPYAHRCHFRHSLTEQERLFCPR